MYYKIWRHGGAVMVDSLWFPSTMSIEDVIEATQDDYDFQTVVVPDSED
jgi:hypothetical protein